MKTNKIIFFFIKILVINLSLGVYIVNKNDNFNLFLSFLMPSIESKPNDSGINKNLFKSAIGTLDPSFGSNGIVITDIKKSDKSRESNDSAKAIALQPDGKILVAGDSGYKNYNNNDIIVMRYNTNGSLDRTFGIDGIVKTDISESKDKANAIALQPDGKILIAGESNESIVLLRYNTDGSLDRTFGIDGIVKTDISEGKDKANAIALQPDGKILIAGESNKDITLLRYNTNGILDKTFGTNGIVITDINDKSFDSANAIALQPDGKILVAGNSFSISNNDMVVIRYNSNGSLDGTFGTGGKVIKHINDDDSAKAIALQPDGKILVAGVTVQGSIYDEVCSWYIVLLRYNSNGTLDKTFGTSGIIKTDIYKSCDPNEYVNAIALQPDGKIFVVGELDSGMGFYAKIVVLRYNSKGSLDQTFGKNGIVITEISKHNVSVDSANAIALQSDGKILVAGESNKDIALLRYDSNGLIDRTFGTNGIVITDIYKDVSVDFANAIALQPDGKILIAGVSSNGEAFGYGYDDIIVLLRYNSNGSLDRTFGGGGIVKTNVNENDISVDSANAITLQPDGKILVTGNIGFANSDFVVLRYNSDGSYDRKFGTDGIVITDISERDQSNAIVIQSEGKILVAGKSNHNIAIVRYK